MSARHTVASAGFTLVELVVTLAIAAMLAVLATAGYAQTVRRTHRLDARAALVAIAAAQERHYLRHSRYADALAPASDGRGDAGGPPGDGDGTGDATADPATLRYPSVSPDGHYALALTGAADGPAFTAVATARGAQTADTECAAFTLDHTGRRGATDAAGEDSTARCWR